MTPPAPAELAEIALEVAREAAELVRGRRAAGVSVAATKSSDVDVVTEADRASEALIRSRILARRPDDAFLGEEGDDVAGRSGVRWIVDPIDGTVNFLYGIAQYAVSVAAEVDGEVVAGVVLNAATGIEYLAHVGEHGGDGVVTRDGAPIGVRGPAPLAHRLLATGFNYDVGLRQQQMAAMGRLISRVRDIRRIGASALDCCMVADGSVDGYFEEGVHLWDTAAGALVATLAGARVGLYAGPSGRRMIVCAPTHGFDELRDALQDAGFLSEEAPDWRE